MGSIETIVSDLEYGRSQLCKSIEGLSRREMTEIPIYEDWTIKDVLAHIVGWDQRTVRTLPLMRQDRASEIVGIEVEAHNRASIATWQDASLAEVLTALKSTHRHLLEILSTMDHVEIDMRRQRNDRIITVRSYVIDVMMEHDRHHAAEIEQWRKALEQKIDPKAIITRLSQNQADFWAALEGLEESVLVDKRAVDGWSLKDMVGHIAAWEELMLEAAHHIHDPSQPKVVVFGDDIESMNAIMVAKREKNSWQTERQYLLDIQSALKELLSKLLPGDFRLRGPYPWPDDQGCLAELITVAADHYDDHLSDIERWRSKQLN